MNQHSERIIHLADLSFIRFCNAQYGVNRGVYNTIDAWFYEQGVENIIERRKHVITFLDFITKEKGEESTRVKFGSGCLTMKLQEYFSRVNNNQYLEMVTS